MRAATGNYHVEYEEWVEDNFGVTDKYDLGNFANINAEMANYNSQDDARTTLTKTAEATYANPEAMYNGSESTRLNIARIVVPKSIATTVTILTKAINILYGEDSL